MWSKKIKGKKLAVQILEYLLISVLVSGFVFCFLYYLSGTLAENYFVYRGMELTRVQERVLAVWRSSICAFGALAVFVVLFLFMLGQRLSYLIRIIRGVERLREQEETEGKDGKTAPAEIPLEGNDELAELAGAINYLSAARRELDMRERRMQEEKEAWIRSLSHDIRTPLTSMLSYSELVLSREETDREELFRALVLTREKARQIKELTDQLMEGERQKEEPAEDLGLLFAQLAQEWEAVLEERFAVQTEVSGLAGASGMADIDSLQRVWDNLISNVEKYADPDQPVTLKIERGPDEAERGGVRAVITQKNAVRKDDFYKESYGIGLKNIRRIVSRYQGEAEVTEDGESFQIRIRLYFPPLLQNYSEIPS